MSILKNRCAFLTMDNLTGFECYDHLLVEPLYQKGWKVDSVSWKNKSANWNDYDIVLVRSTWDYQHDLQSFRAVLENIDSSSAKLINPIQMLLWNMEKIYLKELAAKGIPIIPTIWSKTFEPENFQKIFTFFGCDEIVVKPMVSANATGTFRFKKNGKNFIANNYKALNNKEIIIQPFIENVVMEGEYSLIFFNHQFSHGLLKTPKAGDFRTQEEHGGVLKVIHKPEETMLKLAEQTLSMLSEPCLYARVDMVRCKDGFRLMELELIEPSLYFNLDPAAAYRFADQFEKYIDQYVVYE